MAEFPYTIQQIPVTQIVPGPNDRHDVDEQRLTELAASIQTNGLAQPITVRPRADGRYEIVAGERRFRAMAVRLKRSHIPCIIRDLDDEMASAIMLVENSSRQDLNPYEQACAYRVRMEHFGWSVEEVARAAGVHKVTVERRLSLFKLEATILPLVKTGQLPLHYAEELPRLDHNRQHTALRLLQETTKMTLPTFRNIVQQLYAEQHQERLFDTEPFQLQAPPRAPSTGPRARISVPTRDDMPMIQIDHRCDTVGTVFEKYIIALGVADRHPEAALLGSLYTALVQAHLVRTPRTAVMAPAEQAA